MDHSPDRLRYLSQYSRTEELVLAIVLIFIIVFSIYGNVVMLVILYKNDKMWTSTNLLIGNLSFTGVCVTAVCMPFSLMSVLNGGWIFGEGPVCKFNAMTSSMFLLVTIFTHTIVSVDKFFAVVKPFSRAMTVGRTRLIIASTWGLAAIMTVLPILNFGHFEYNQTTLVCGASFPHTRTDMYYLIALAGLGYGIPVLIMGYVYCRIFLAVRSHKRRLLTTGASSLEVVYLQNRLIGTVFCSLLCFLLCWSPFCILALMAAKVRRVDELPRGLGVAAYWCGYLNCCLYPAIICSMNLRFNAGLFSITKEIVLLPSRLAKKFCFPLCTTSSEPESMNYRPKDWVGTLDSASYAGSENSMNSLLSRGHRPLNKADRVVSTQSIITVC